MRITFNTLDIFILDIDNQMRQVRYSFRLH